MLIDTQGNLLYSVTRESDLGENLFLGQLNKTRFAKTVRQVLQDGESRFSDLLFYPPLYNPPVGFLVGAMRDHSENITGVIAIRISMQRIFDAMKLENQMHLYLVGEDQLLRSPVNDEREILNRKLDLSILHEGHIDDHGHHAYNGIKGSRAIGFTSLIELPGVNWMLVSEMDHDTALETIHWLQHLMIVLVVITALISIVLAVFKARSITRPIESLLDTTIKVGQGQLQKRASVSGNNEITSLAETFNHMLDQRQQYEDELSLREQQLSEVLHDLKQQKFALDQHAIVAITDVKGNITYANKMFCEISGYAENELLGQNHRILNSGHHSEAFWRDMYKTVAAGGVWHAEVCNRAKQGNLYWVSTTIVPFMGEDGKPESYVAIRTDISDRVNADTILEESRSKLEMVIDATAVGVWNWQVVKDVVMLDQRWA